jgi:hypothetical protein
LNNKSFNYIHTIVRDALVTFTNNINIQKWAINGATTTITSVIFDPKNNITGIEVQLTTNSIQMTLKEIHFNTNIHMMDIIIKHHFQSHWHMLLLAAITRCNN